MRNFVPLFFLFRALTNLRGSGGFSTAQMYATSSTLSSIRLGISAGEALLRRSASVSTGVRCCVA